MKDRSLLFAGIVLLLAYLAPNHYPPWVSFHADAMTALAFVPILIWALRRRGALPSLAKGALLIACVPLAQLAAGKISFAGDAIIASLYITGFALAVICGSRVVAGKSQTKNPLIALAPLQVGLVLAGLISTGIALHQWLNLGILAIFIVDLPAGSRPFANLAQPNQLATLLMMGLAAVVFLYEGALVRASIAAMAALVLCLGLAMTQSRAVLLGIVAIWVLYYALRNRTFVKLNATALLAFTTIYLVLVWTFSSIGDFLLLSHNVAFGDRMVDNLRVTLWRSMIDALGRQPWTGYGWNQVALAQQATAAEYPATHWWFESSHNVVLDLAIWAGLPIAILTTAGVLMWWKNRISECRDPLSWSLLAGVAVVFCHAMVEYPLAYAYFLLPVGFLMGALNSKAGGDRNVRVMSRAVPVAVGAVALTVFAKVAVEYLALEEEWRNIRTERVFVGGVPAPPATNVLLLTQLKARASFARLTPASAVSDELLQWMGLVARRYPTANFMFPYARQLDLNGKHTAAMDALRLMCRFQQPSACQRTLKEWKDLGYSLNPEFEFGVGLEKS